MNRIESISERALELASSMGDNVRQALPKAGHLLEAGAKLGVLKTGARVAGKFARRNPVLVAAAIAGAGVLWFAARQRAKRAEQGNGDREAIEGNARRVEARRGNGARRTRTTGAGGRGSRARTESSTDT
jgi:hypothetical protein